MIDRPPETFFSSSSSFEANVRTTFDLVMILESRAFPSIPSSSKKIFFTGFFLYLFLQRYREGRVTKKARLIFSGSSAILIYRCREGIFRQRGCFSFRRIRQTESTIFIVCMIIFLTERTSCKRTPLLFPSVSRQYLKVDNFERSLESIANAIKRILHTIILLTWRYPTTMTTNAMRL